MSKTCPKNVPVVDPAFWHTPWGAFGTFPEIWEMPWGAFVAPPETHGVVLGGVGGARFGSRGALGGAWERSPGGGSAPGRVFRPWGRRGPRPCAWSLGFWGRVLGSVGQVLGSWCWVWGCASWSWSLGAGFGDLEARSGALGARCYDLCARS